MAKQMNGLQVEHSIRQRGPTLFTRASQRGDVIKQLRRERYVLPDHPAPDYVSFEYALGYCHLIPEAVYEVTSATARTSRRFEAQ